jgi:hypothetical protein
MANNLLVRYKIRTNRGAGVLAGNFINVYWDDVAAAFVVHHFDDENDTTGTVLTSGPDLGADRFDYEKVDGIVRPPEPVVRGGTPDPPGTVYGSRYRFCDATTLVSFTPISLFPYAKKVLTENHFSCALAACDLKFGVIYNWNPATDLVTPDGWLEARAYSSHGTVKYSLDPNFDYATQGQTAALFENLYAGTYTVTAKDAMGCMAQKTITIRLASIAHAVLYRMDYMDINGTPSRVDILERGYAGSVIEVDGGNGDPVILTYDLKGEVNKFSPIMASSLSITLWSPTNGFFQNLFSQDERKFQVKFYKGASYDLKWFGYLISSNHVEPYVGAPYQITLTATDGLADLQHFDFVDADRNKYNEDIITLTAICEILGKTGLEINIQSAINQFETRMAQLATDDPLPQCKINPETFYTSNSKCFDVLKEILKPFRSRICQRNGKWFIYNVEQAIGAMAYREFDFKGTYITNSTINDVARSMGATDSNRVVFLNNSAVQEFIPTYGTFYFEHTLLKHSSLIASYGFEPEDIIRSLDGLEHINHWNVNISNAPGAEYGIKKTQAFEGDYNFYLKYKQQNNVADGVYMTAAPITIEYENTDAFEFRFSYAALLAPGAFGQVYWVKLKWMFKVGSYYYNENGGWTTDVNQKYNDVIIDRFNEIQEKKVTALLRNVVALTEETAEVEFILCNESVYDFEDITALKATPSTTKATGTKMKVKSGDTLLHYYVLEEGTDAESGFDIIRPDDYDASIIKKIWVAEHLSVSNRGRVIQYSYLDNVVLLHHPDAEEAPNDITIERLNNTGIRVTFEETYLLNDIDIKNINNSERTYKNFFKLLNGTPTQTWARAYRVGEGKLLELLTSDYVSQYKTASKKLTGQLTTDIGVTPVSAISEVFDSNRKYMFMGYELHDKHQEITFDLVELKDAINPESNDLDAGFTSGFSLGFRS